VCGSVQSCERVQARVLGELFCALLRDFPYACPGARSLPRYLQWCLARPACQPSYRFRPTHRSSRYFPLATRRNSERRNNACASPYETPLPKQASEGLIHYLIMGRRHGVYPLPPACGDAANPGPTVTTYS